MKERREETNEKKRTRTRYDDQCILKGKEKVREGRHEMKI